MAHNSKKQANKHNFQKFLGQIKEKRLDKCSTSLEYLTVQRLSPNVEGKYQKYSRIGPLTMVKFNDDEMSLANIKRACVEHFDVAGMECDILAGERGPSYTECSQIKNFNLLHVRFVESSGRAPMKKINEGDSHAPAPPRKRTCGNMMSTRPSFLNSTRPSSATNFAKSMLIYIYMTVGHLLQVKLYKYISSCFVTVYGIRFSNKLAY